MLPSTGHKGASGSPVLGQAGGEVLCPAQVTMRNDRFVLARPRGGRGGLAWGSPAYHVCLPLRHGD